MKAAVGAWLALFGIWPVMTGPHTISNPLLERQTRPS